MIENIKRLGNQEKKCLSWFWSICVGFEGKRGGAEFLTFVEAAKLTRSMDLIWWAICEDVGHC